MREAWLESSFISHIGLSSDKFIGVCFIKWVEGEIERKQLISLICQGGAYHIGYLEDMYEDYGKKRCESDMVLSQ
ncbi:unnamed protein product [Lactuca virosa]|uniref:Uncharacterized protein n=1 Tax=Lactuca virosa TaxID=75947 RepID=A0AAU9MMH1_9ASTR|nr:unnamed protein product [Lactuca virosa]